MRIKIYTDEWSYEIFTLEELDVKLQPQRDPDTSPYTVTLREEGPTDCHNYCKAEGADKCYCRGKALIGKGPTAIAALEDAINSYYNR